MAARAGPSLLACVEQLIEVTDQMLGAAKRLESERLSQLSAQRSDLVFEVQVIMADPPSADSQLIERIRFLKDLEVRLSQVCSTVVNVLQPLMPAPKVQRYGPSGQLAHR